MKIINFSERIDNWKKYFGLIYACFQSFGFCLLVLLLSKTCEQSVVNIFSYSVRVITRYIAPMTIFMLYLTPIVKSLENISKIKVFISSLIILSIIFASFIISRFFENNLLIWLGANNLESFNSKMLSQEIEISTPKLDKMYTILKLSFIGPFCEEMSYRVCLFRFFRNRVGVLSHILTALLFAFQHISVGLILYGQKFELLFMTSHFIFSLIMSSAYAKLKTCIPGILAHMFYNFIHIISF